jgi:hypothetical protein
LASALGAVGGTLRTRHVKASATTVSKANVKVSHKRHSRALPSWSEGATKDVLGACVEVPEVCGATHDARGRSVSTPVASTSISARADE